MIEELFFSFFEMNLFNLQHDIRLLFKKNFFNLELEHYYFNLPLIVDILV